MRTNLAPKARAPRTSKASAPPASAKRERPRSSVLAIAIVMGVACTASAQDPFPDGPGKDVTVRI